MSVVANAGRSHWEEMLRVSATRVPRWSTDPTPTVLVREVVADAHTAQAARAVAAALGTRLDTVLLAAHAKVLSALLGGEAEVVAGWCAGAGGSTLPLRLSAAPVSWRQLVAGVGDVLAEALAHADFPFDALVGQLGLSRPPYDTVLDLHVLDGELEPEVAVRLGVSTDDGLTVHASYRGELVDASAVDRLVGYHFAALRRMAQDVDADHQEGTLLSAAELSVQLDGLGGPERPLPDCPAHEVFEERVRLNPDAVAAEQGLRRWTYAELNGRANRIARALGARGVGAETVVAVVMERNLDWLATVLGVMKAGGAYLPLEPRFPADRIARILTRADARVVVTERGSTATLDRALATVPDVEPLLVDAAYAEARGDHDLGVAVGADQLAYLYFTSGSTGEPKGAMCEHRGMLNHLFAKIDDLEIGADDVVAQTAPQCFDISLWQLVAALLVGGRTLIVEQDVVLDVGRFVDRVVEGRVSVLQVVPSYLEAVLTHFEQDQRALPDLRCVSVTGEALKKPLVQRWFAAHPGITLVNAYGLTETSDDTNHEVMHRVPSHDTVPIGRPVNNVRVYVVDDDLAPVPLGSPGEIVFSGVCVGRGYVNDPERTREAFMDDPHRPGERLYRGGDLGRWLPQGTLEFLGRRDSQVKVSGFRIEIGEIENALLRVPGVRDGAVVVADRAGQGRHLVGFCAGDGSWEPQDLRTLLGASLPAYMVPQVFHRLDRLPLTPNSKVDRKSLTALAGRLGEPAAHQDPPVTPTEQRLADAWAPLLGIPAERIGRSDHFFDLGGSSLTAVRLVVAMHREVSLKDVTRHPVLADLAALVDGHTDRRAVLLQPVSGEESAHRGLLVCFPWAGGNAINYRAMALALRGSGIAVVAVELPGHDLAADAEPFAALDTVVDTVVDEIIDAGGGPVILWGHSSGAAYAVETARRLERRGRAVARVFIAAQLLRTAQERRRELEELHERSDSQLVAALASRGGVTGPAAMDGRRELLGAAFRHDCVSAHRYFIALLEEPPDTRVRAPVTVVAADDDPSTPAAQEEYVAWHLVADHLDVVRLRHGGHYFIHTRPAEAAEAVVRTTVLSPSH